MSKIALEGNASGTGTFTLASPNSSTDRTLDLPDASGVIDRLNRAGNVLQVVSATTQSSTSTTSTSFVTTSFSVSITPTAATNKILVMLSGGNFDNNSVLNEGITATFYRNATNIGGTEGIYLARATTTRLLIGGSLLVYDSPSTTSATTYTLYIKSEAGQSVSFNSSGNLLSTLIAMEIAG